MTERRKVLIIDDEVDLCLLLKGYFQKKDFDVFIAHTLREGIEMADRIIPDLLFIDNNLPDGFGWSEAPALAQRFPSLLINLISAYHPTVPDMPAGAQVHVFEKPISLKDLDIQLAATSPIGGSTV